VELSNAALEPTVPDESSESINPTGDVRADTSNPSVALDVYCHECGYNLRGLTGTRCPECGKDSPALANAEPNIPWVHRARLGNLWAFTKTVLFASFRPRKLSQNVFLHIDFCEAKRFRRWVIAVTMFWMIGLTAFLYAIGPNNRLYDREFAELLKLYWPMALGNVLMLPFLLLATGIPSLFFDYRDLPVSLRNNAIALSYYCCAPLAWWPLPVIGGVGLLMSDPMSIENDMIAIPLIIAGALLPLMPIAIWSFSLLRLASRIMSDHQLRIIWMAAGIPLLWLLSVLLVFGLIPMAGFYVWVLIDALS